MSNAAQTTDRADATRLLVHWRRRAAGIRAGRSIETNENAAKAIDVCVATVGSRELHVNWDAHGGLWAAISAAGLLSISAADTADVTGAVNECVDELDRELLALNRGRVGCFVHLAL